MQALFPNIAVSTLAINLDLATYGVFDGGRKRLAGSIVGLLGILLLFPLGLSGVCGLAGCRENAGTNEASELCSRSCRNAGIRVRSCLDSRARKPAWISSSLYG